MEENPRPHHPQIPEGAVRSENRRPTCNFDTWGIQIHRRAYVWATHVALLARRAKARRYGDVLAAVALGTIACPYQGTLGA